MKKLNLSKFILVMFMSMKASFASSGELYDYEEDAPEQLTIEMKMEMDIAEQIRQAQILAEEGKAEEAAVLLRLVISTSMNTFLKLGAIEQLIDLGEEYKQETVVPLREIIGNAEEKLANKAQAFKCLSKVSPEFKQESLNGLIKIISAGDMETSIVAIMFLNDIQFI